MREQNHVAGVIDYSVGAVGAGLVGGYCVVASAARKA